MSSTNATALSVGVLAGLSIYLADLVDIPPWLTFLAWLTVYFCGGGREGVRLQVTNNLWGVLVGAAALWVLAEAATGLWLTAVALGVAAFVIAQSARFGPLSQTPAGFVGLAMAAAAAQVAPVAITDGSRHNPVLVAVGAVVLGSLLALASDLLSSILSGDRPRSEAAEFGAVD
ncbi:DUF1097 domain-containing protein [Aeromicrobium sp.]|uniref:DUF1097 domain-containing protein n=1 Tax=Aeromicrobium sp. TaxID=1871063 RepID=UPI002FC820CB